MQVLPVPPGVANVWVMEGSGLVAACDSGWTDMTGWRPGAYNRQQPPATNWQHSSWQAAGSARTSRVVGGWYILPCSFVGVAASWSFPRVFTPLFPVFSPLFTPVFTPAEESMGAHVGDLAVEGDYLAGGAVGTACSSAAAVPAAVQQYATFGTRCRCSARSSCWSLVAQ